MIISKCKHTKCTHTNANKHNANEPIQTNTVQTRTIQTSQCKQTNANKPMQQTNANKPMLAGARAVGRQQTNAGGLAGRAAAGRRTDGPKNLHVVNQPAKRPLQNKIDTANTCEDRITVAAQCSHFVGAMACADLLGTRLSEYRAFFNPFLLEIKYFPSFSVREG